MKINLPKKDTEDDPVISQVSFVDISLVLIILVLIFFHFMNPNSINVYRIFNEGDVLVQNGETSTVKISIDSQGQIFHGNLQIPQNEIYTYIKSLPNRQAIEQFIILTQHDTKAKHFALVADAARTNGISNVLLLTKKGSH